MTSYASIPNVDFCIALLGGGGVGKTALLRSFLGQTFNEEHLPTVDDYYVHRLNVDGSHITICVVDTAGSYSFPVMRKLALTLSHGFIVVYALDDIQSFKEALTIMDQISDLRTNGQESVPVFLVGNKLDIDMKDRKVNPNQAHESFATLCRLEGQYIETSAKVEFRVEKVFLEIIRTLIYKRKEKERQNWKARLSRRKKKLAKRREYKQKENSVDCALM
ncbi:ras-related protein Rap-2a-like [Montipora capricornis]|uniref:ras-related protein Rap-2a-like n=1 Tax=Montipora capricornis TaxID=246305 RepID=UPI0035F1C725